MTENTVNEAEYTELDSWNNNDKVSKYYTATQWKLMRWRFLSHKSALAASIILLLLALSGTFAGFFSPYTGTERNPDYILGPPQIPRFFDENGFSIKPFVYNVKTVRDPVTFRPILEQDRTSRRYISLFIKGEEYKILRLFKSDIHLFGVKDSYVHIFGTDKLGRDVYSRLLYATGTSLSIGMIGVVIAFILGLIIGGVAGYCGGWTDYTIQRITEIVRIIPVVPLYMGLAAAFPKNWSTLQVYFAMTLILGLVGWPTLARRIRGQLMSLRNEDYVTAAMVSGAGAPRIISVHLLPAFTSYIIVDLVISFPYMILSESTLSFVGLGLRPPVISWGVMLQDAQNIRVIEQAPWLLIPTLFLIVSVLAFTVIGDGVRDAADPYLVT